MKNISRRLFAALAATMMIAALGLAGCGGQSSEEPAKGAESGQEQPYWPPVRGRGPRRASR